MKSIIGLIALLGSSVGAYYLYQYLDERSSYLNAARDTYSKAKATFTANGSWKFPNRKFANYLLRYHALPEHKADIVAGYPDIPRYATQIANVVGGGVDAIYIEEMYNKFLGK